MSWFPVDDGAHSHPKMRRAGLEAVGLWTVSGSFCMAYLTDGFVPEWFVREKPKGMALAKRLVEAGLWRQGVNGEDKGWWFHDWKPECTKSHIEEVRANARLRKQKSRAFRRDDQQPSRVTDAVTGYVTDAGRDGGVLGYPTQPNPTQPISTSVVTSRGDVAKVDARDPQRCPDHPNGTTAACGGCADARRAHADEIRRRNSAEATERRRSAQAAADAVAACNFCDDDGYRGIRVCDHTDRRDTARSGLAAVRAALSATEAG